MNNGYLDILEDYVRDSHGFYFTKILSRCICIITHQERPQAPNVLYFFHNKKIYTLYIPIHKAYAILDLYKSVTSAESFA